MSLRILVTGARGFVGASIAHEASALGHVVARLDADIRNRSDVEREVAARDFDTVIHAAAVTQGSEEEIEHVNVNGTANLLAAACGPHLERFVFVSSSAVYGAPADSAPIRETHPLRGRGPYAISKGVGESLCRETAALTGTSLAICRLGAVYGPMEKPSPHRTRLSLPTRLARRADDPKPFDVHGLEHRRAFLHVDDAAGALLRLALSDGLSEDTFNLDGPAEISLAELLALVGRTHPSFRYRAVGHAKDAELALTSADARPRLDCSRLEAAIGKLERRSIARGLAEGGSER